MSSINPTVIEIEIGQIFSITDQKSNYSGLVQFISIAYSDKVIVKPLSQHSKPLILVRLNQLKPAQTTDNPDQRGRKLTQTSSKLTQATPPNASSPGPGFPGLPRRVLKRLRRDKKKRQGILP